MQLQVSVIIEGRVDRKEGGWWGWGATGGGDKEWGNGEGETGCGNEEG